MYACMHARMDVYMHTHIRTYHSTTNMKQVTHTEYGHAHVPGLAGHSVSAMDLVSYFSKRMILLENQVGSNGIFGTPPWGSSLDAQPAY